MNKFGIDISEHQGSIVWAEVARHVGFVFVKATEGLDFVDHRFGKQRVAAIRDADIPFGAYHFARPQPGRDGADEAKFHVRTVRDAGGLKPGDLPCVLDIETASGVDRATVRRFVRRFVHRYRDMTGHRPIIYTGSFWRDFLGNPLILGRCRLWLAAYTSSWHNYTPRAWKRPFFWQYTDHADVPGISGPVDGNKLLRNRRRFRRALIKKKRRTR